MERATGSRFEAWPPARLDFEQLALAALYFHPSLDVARAQWEVSRAAGRSAEARPNPTVNLQPGYNFSAAGGATPWIPGLNLDWPIETAGKRGRRIDRAAHLTEAARLGVFQAAWQIRASLRTALLDLAAAWRRESLLERQAEISRGLLGVLDQRLAAGAVSQLEVAPFRTAALKVASDLAESRRAAQEARVRVAEALGVPVQALGGIELGVELGASPSVTPDPDPASAHRAALQNRADVRALLEEYAAAEAGVRLEIARQYPDVHLGNGYQWDQGESKWTLGIGLELPVLSRNQGPIAESIARRGEVGARFTALESRVLAEVDRALAARRTAREQVERAAALLASHRRQLESLRAAFQAGGADQLDVRTAELEAAAAELLHLDALIRADQALGDLQQALQAPFPGGGLLVPSAPQSPASPPHP